MIVYDAKSWGGYGVLCHVSGSVFHKVILQALIAMGISIGASLSVDPKVIRDVVVHPSPVLYPITFVLGFLLVYRSNLAYQRYWEGRTHLAMFSSKMGDVVQQIHVFLADAKAISAESNNSGSDGNGSSIGIKKEAVVVRATRLALLMHKLALMRLRGDTELAPLVQGGTMTPGECACLSQVPDRVFLVNHWLHSALCEHGGRAMDGLSVAPPVFSRTFQVLSEAHMFFNQARKVRETPFPFPYVQMVWLLLHVDAVAVAFVASAYITNTAACAIMVFFVVLSLFTVNECATELESPFGCDANHLPLTAMDVEFSLQVATLARDTTKREKEDARMSLAGGMHGTDGIDDGVDMLAMDGGTQGIAEADQRRILIGQLQHTDSEFFSSGDVPFTISALRAKGGFGRID